ncbi:hypothetical protein JCM17845_04090 [Iodidimonas gelatinilytica]|uniref:Uncharacterized protein n=1 Tax=Iodidimonas gelatinilytica TaxID=1236966 RepID=A0A5A7MY59_9PROT|nr:hypothetical protein JCM17845_04090 [Iodidimonas gelatinilytica]
MAEYAAKTLSGKTLVNTARKKVENGGFARLDRARAFILTTTIMLRGDERRV